MPPSSLRTTLGLTATLLGAASQSLSAAAVDAAPGFFFSSLPFTDTGTTVGMVSDIDSLPLNVSTFQQVLGSDVFYTFNVAVAGLMTFKVTPTGNTGYDPALYLLAGTPAGTSGVPGGGRDANGGNMAEQFSISLNPGTYYLVVDSFYSTGPASAGSYMLEVTGTARIPEPGSTALAAAALSTAVWRRRRRGSR